MAWFTVPFNWAFMVVGLGAGAAAYFGMRDYFDPAPADGIDLTPVTARLDQMIDLIRQGALTSELAQEAAELAVKSLPSDGSSSNPLIASFAETVATVSQSPSSEAREAIALELSGNREEAFDRLIALGELEAGKSAERFRQAGALAAPTDVSKAIRAYARAADLEPGHCWTWIELARLHEAAGSTANARRCAERALQHVENDRDRLQIEMKLGDVCMAEGNLPAAIAHFSAANSFSSKGEQATQLETQYDLLAVHQRMGAALLAAGNLQGAEQELQAALRIVESLSSELPDHEVILHSKAVIRLHLGDLAFDCLDLTQARLHFEEGIETAAKLAAKNRSNSYWQRDLAALHTRMGELEDKALDFPAAKEHFETALTIAKEIAAADPSNSISQRDLSITHNRLGDLLLRLGEMIEARSHFELDLAISTRLAASDPGNSEWQRDLSVTLNKLGMLALALGDLKEAKRRFGADLVIAQRLAASNAKNAGWCRDVFVSHTKLAQVAEAMGDWNAALDHLEQGERIIGELSGKLVDHAEINRDLALVRLRIQHIRLKLGKDAP